MVSSLPTLSIIVCSLNDHIRLESTLSSIVAQDYPKTELIVIDGGSSAKTLEILDKYARFIGTLISEKDHGIYDAMNKGTQLANGEWLLYLNCGDTLCSQFPISNVIEDLDGRLDYVSFSYFVKIGSEKYLIQSTKNPKWGMKPGVHQAILFQKSKLPELVYNLDYKICADYELTKRLKHFAISNHPICNYQIGIGYSKIHPYRSIYECYKINKNYINRPLNEYHLFISFLKVIFFTALRRFNLHQYYFRIRQRFRLISPID
jgi:glycosyltransferase involved in cell wall biosynthesis